MYLQPPQAASNTVIYEWRSCPWQAHFGPVAKDSRAPTKRDIISIYAQRKEENDTNYFSDEVKKLPTIHWSFHNTLCNIPFQCQGRNNTESISLPEWCWEACSFTTDGASIMAVDCALVFTGFINENQLVCCPMEFCMISKVLSCNFITFYCSLS